MYTENHAEAKAGKSLRREAASARTTTSVALLGLQTEYQEGLAPLELVALEIPMPSGNSLTSPALLI